MSNSKLQVGFTLLETIVAFAVIFAALVGPVSLITRGLIDVTFAKNKLIALNLAQEGIELVRLTRDNNILCDYLDGGAEGSWRWDHEPGGGGGNVLDPQSEGNPTTLRTDMSPDFNDLEEDDCGPYEVRSPDFRNLGSNPLLQIDSQGFYQYDSGSESPFRRTISIDMRTVGAGLNRMEITSEVTWTERGRARQFILRDALYNWR